MDRGLLVERRLRGAELALAEARRELERTQAMAGRLDQRVRALERELDDARRERRRLRELLGESERARRRAEQHAHSERAQRERLEEIASALERRQREQAAARLEEARLRVRELERELLTRRREADELRHLLAAAASARRRAEQRAGELEARLFSLEQQAQPPALMPAFDALLLRAEGELARRPVAAAANGNGGQARSAGLSQPLTGALEAERALLAARASLGHRQGPGELQQGLGEPSEQLEGARPAAADGAESRAAGDGGVVLAALAHELATLAGLAERQRQARIAAEARAAELERELHAARRAPDRASEAIELLRGEIGALLGLLEQAEGAEAREEPAVEAADGPGAEAREEPAVEAADGPGAEAREEPAVEAADGPGAEARDEPAAEASEAAETPEEAAAKVPEALAAEAPVEAAAASGQQPAADPAGPVAPERLSAALARLREITPPREEEPDDAGSPEMPANVAVVPIPPPAPPPRPWLREAFRMLARNDPPAAGSLLLALLPLQSLVHPEPLAYDIVLSGIECVHVTIDGSGQRIARFPWSRSLDQLDFRVSGDVAQLGRLLAARGLRRRFGRGLARVEGSWRHFRALEALLDARLRLRELPAAGVELPPQLTVQLIAAMLPPQLAGGAEFTLAHRDPAHGGAGCFLSIRRSGSPLAGTIAPGLEPSLTIWCVRQVLPAVLDGGEPDQLGARVEGAVEHLAQLRSWLEAAQSA